jgi:hypothetical protein
MSANEHDDDQPDLEDKIEAIIEWVRMGQVSVRFAAVRLDWTVEDVCLAAFGEVTL